MTAPGFTASTALEALENELSAALGTPEAGSPGTARDAAQRPSGDKAPAPAEQASPRPLRQPPHALLLGLLSLCLMGIVAILQFDPAMAGNRIEITPGILPTETGRPPETAAIATDTRVQVPARETSKATATPLAPALPVRPAASPPLPTTAEMAAPTPRFRVARPLPADSTPQQDAARQALRRGDWEAASTQWQTLLKQDAEDTEAWLGLANLAEHQGDSRRAEAYRERARQADPTDPAVLAAWLGGSSTGNDPAQESRLRGLLHQHPESAPLHFALGNILARQARWREAQQAYFNAVAGDRDNPDYLFNLAVSLEHLHQSPAAARQYRLALQAADHRAAAFPRAQLEQRVAALEAETQ